MPSRRFPKPDVDVMHEENLSRISSQQVRTAYIYLIRMAQSLDGYECYPTQKGALRNFRYYFGSDQPFSFIVNVESLLFYIRKPVIDNFRAKLPRLRKLFLEVNEPRSHELTIRIRDVGDARRLMKEVFDVVDT